LATYLTLQTRVLSNIIDAPPAVQTNVPVFVNAAYSMLQSIHNFQCMQAEAPYITAAANVSLYPPNGQTHILGSIPARWKTPRGEAYYQLAIGSTRLLLWQPSREYMYREWNPTDTNQIGPPRNLLLGEPINPSIGTGTSYAAWASGTSYLVGQYVTYPGSSPMDPIFISIQAGSNKNPLTQPTYWTAVSPESDALSPDYAITARNIEVYPYPDFSSDWSDGNYRVNVPFWQYLPALSANGDSSWLTADGPQAEFLVAWATGMGFDMDWDDGEGAGGRAQGWYRRAAGPKFDGANAQTLGGWGRQVLNLDVGIVGNPAKALIPRRDMFGMRDQWRQ
jgi:hypothetical protein